MMATSRTDKSSWSTARPLALTCLWVTTLPPSLPDAMTDGALPTERSACQPTTPLGRQGAWGGGRDDGESEAEQNQSAPGRRRLHRLNCSFASALLIRRDGRWDGS